MHKSRLAAFVLDSKVDDIQQAKLAPIVSFKGRQALGASVPE